MNSKKLRIYMTIDRAEAEKIEGFIEAYIEREQEKVARFIDSKLVTFVRQGDIVLFFPSLDFPPTFTDKQGDYQDQMPGPAVINGLCRLVLSFASDDAALLGVVRESAERFAAFSGVGTDLAFDAVDHWCPNAPPGHQFSERAAAARLIGADSLVNEKLFGCNVNVIVVDRGLNEDDVRAKLKGKFGGGWEYCPEGVPTCIQPGTLEVIRGVTDNGHGMMIARNVLAVAPAVTLHDLPLIPARIASISSFLTHAHAAFERILADLRQRHVKDNNERWIVVNAWAIFDRLTELPPGDYSTNQNHPFNLLIDEMVDENLDVVFAAGNCGQFCPDPRCGLYDVGPGKSVFGANAHPRVLSVGAVRIDATWVGSSSQGPGPEALEKKKPDLSAPSMFSERNDRHTRNGGTSAACAVAAGVLAAFRQNWGPTDVPPNVMRQCLRNTAWRAGPPAWDGRFGYGIINAKAVLKKLPPRPP